jgi:nitroreductase
MKVNELIIKRYSPRSFESKLVEQDKIMTIFEAAKWAASSRNEQPWRFIYASKYDNTDYNRLLSCLNEWNQNWVKTAPVIIMTVAKSTFSHNNQANRHAWHDIGLAVGNMAIQATEMGLFLHIMSGFSKTKAIELLNIPEGYEPVTMIALGYEGNSNHLAEEYNVLTGTERNRKELKEIVHKGTFKY